MEHTAQSGSVARAEDSESSAKHAGSEPSTTSPAREDSNRNLMTAARFTRFCACWTEDSQSQKVEGTRENIHGGDGSKPLSNLDRWSRRTRACEIWNTSTFAAGFFRPLR